MVAQVAAGDDIARAFGQDRELAVALQTYATVLIGRVEHAKAQVMVCESLEALRRDPSFLFIARAIDLYANSAADREPERAARAIGIALTMRRHIGANRFEHDEVLIAGLWRDDVQDRLRTRFCDAGLRLGALLAEAGDDDSATATYERVVACESLHEAAHRGLLLALTRGGRRAHALRHYDRLATLLQELELEPEAETVELLGRIRVAEVS